MVLGMHRSGTSAVTGVLGCVGVQLGRRLYAARAGVNEKGFFEHIDITDTDDEILLALGSSWDDILPLPDGWWDSAELVPLAERVRGYIQRDFSGASLWGLKDPRMCRLLPWWQKLLTDLTIDTRYLVVVRHPLEVARSLEKRDGFSREKSLLLWADHYLCVDRWTRKQKRAVVLYDRLLQAPRKEIERIQSKLDVSFPVAMDDSIECIQRFLSKDMRHHRAHDSDPEVIPGGDPLRDLAMKVYERLSGAAMGHDDAMAEEAMSPLHESIERYRGQFPPLLVENMRAMARHRGRLKRTLGRVLGSWWWSVGKPFRVVERLVRKDRVR